jgi:hypothetical protein
MEQEERYSGAIKSASETQFYKPDEWGKYLDDASELRSMDNLRANAWWSTDKPTTKRKLENLIDDQQKGKGFYRNPILSFAGAVFLPLVIGLGLHSLYGPIKKDVDTSNSNRVQLKSFYGGHYANSGYLEDTNSPPDGIPDVKSYLHVAPSVAWRSYHSCTPEEIRYFQDSQLKRREN